MAPALLLADTPALLLERLLAVLAADRVAALAGSESVPRPVPVVVPSSQLGEWIQAALARRTGIGMGLRFLSGIDPLIQEAGETSPARAWPDDALRWRILPHVDAFARQLGYEEAGALSDRERFACAGLLASQLNRTLRLRPEWATRWRAGLDGLPKDTPDEARADERWQRDLWRRVAQSDGMPPHPAERLTEALPTAESPGSPVHFVSTGRLDPYTLAQVQRLAQAGHAVRMHLLLPSLGYLGDIPSRARLSALASGTVRNEPLDLPGHPLLSSLGQQAVGTFLLLERLQPDYAAWEQDSAESAPAGLPLLARLQHAIRSQKANDETTLAPFDPLDRSLRVHSCHGPRRELEVLRDELLSAFDRIPDLKPSGILVAATDFDTYAPLVDGVLTNGTPPLPIRMTAIDAREANPVTAALLALLKLAHGRVTVSGLIELIALRAIRIRLEVEDAPEASELLAECLRQSGMTQGLGTTEPAPTGSLRASLDRLLAGMWLGPDADARDAGGSWVHPIAGALASVDDPRTRLAEWLSVLLAHLPGWMQPAAASDWAARLGAAVDALLDSDEIEDHTAAARRLLRELHEAPAETPLDTGALIDWLSARLDNETSLRTTLDGSILLGRLDQVQALPCRVLAVLGLQDGLFPKNQRRPAWDLASVRPERWDDDSRARDLQNFLNALLAPTDQLILLSGNRSLRANNDAPIAAPVTEVLRAIDRLVEQDASGARPSERVVIRHHLHPFDLGYFELGATHATYAAGAARVAKLSRNPDAEIVPFLQPTEGVLTTRETSIAVDIEDVIRFWRSPSLHWLRSLGIGREEDEADDRSLDRPPIALDALEGFVVRQVRIDLDLDENATSAECVRSRLAEDRQLPPGALGTLVWDAETQGTRRFIERFLPFHRASTIQRLSLCVETASSSVSIHGTVRLASIAGSTSTEPIRVLVHRPGKYDRKPHYQLGAWIHTLCTAVHLDRSAECVVGSLEDEPVSVKGAVTPAEARQLLEVLISGWLEGRQRPLAFAPNASTAMLKALEAGDSVGALEDARESWEEASGYAQSGEGLAPENELVWRDTDPFAEAHAEQWLHWAWSVARPLQTWWNSQGSIQFLSSDEGRSE